jgi:hypothetical protein
MAYWVEVSFRGFQQRGELCPFLCPRSNTRTTMSTEKMKRHRFPDTDFRLLSIVRLGRSTRSLAMMRAPPPAPENVTGLKPPFVCHVRHEQKRLDLSRVQTMTSAKGPKSLLFALYVMVCHGMSATIMDRHGTSRCFGAFLRSYFILHPSSFILHPSSLRMASFGAFSSTAIGATGFVWLTSIAGHARSYLRGKSSLL